MDAGSVHNTATAEATDPHNTPVSDADSSTVTAAAGTHLTMTKTPSVPTVSSVGDQITYAVTVVNDGNQTLSGVTVTDPRCSPVFGGGDVDGDRLLDVGETWTYSCTYAVTQADIDAGSVRNIATVSADDPHGAPISETAEAVVAVSAAPHMTVIKTPSTPTVAAAGDNVVYTVTVVNDGNETLSAVSVADPLCGPVFGGGDANGNDLLDVGETWMYSCTYAVTQADIDAGSVHNTVTVDADDPHAMPVSGRDSATVTTLAGPHITVRKTPSVAVVTGAGDPIIYTIAVSNDGNTTLSSVVVTDLRCTPVFGSGDGNSNGLLDVGETWTYTCTYAATQA